jgi:hypothetical protein
MSMWRERRYSPRLYSSWAAIASPGFHGRCRCSSSAVMAMLKISGDRMPPYEQCGVMRSAVVLALVAAMLGIEHCA